MDISFVITIDTEPDDQWAPPGLDGKLAPFRFANTRGLQPLSEFFRRLNVPVTWLTSWSVTQDPESVQALKNAHAGGDEIGGHLHGWETPPFLEVDSRHKSFIYEYEPEIRLQKHTALVQALEEAFGERPRSYRAGRWGLDEIEYQHLETLGYQVDSSIPPGIDFRDRFGREQPGPDFRRYMKPDGLVPYRVGNLWEVPASISLIGAWSRNQRAFAAARIAANRRRAYSSAHVLTQILKLTGLQQRIWLRPRKHPERLLVKAAGNLVTLNVPIINIMFHSSEMFLGTSPLSRCQTDVDRSYRDLEAIIHTLQATGKVTGRTLSDSISHYAG